MSELPRPSALVGIKLASIAIHAEEAISPGGHSFDVATLQSMLVDPEVRAYFAELGALALLPILRREESPDD